MAVSKDTVTYVPRVLHFSAFHVPKVRRRARCRNECTAQSNDTLSAKIQLDSVTNQACHHNPLFGRTFRDFEVNPGS